VRNSVQFTTISDNSLQFPRCVGAWSSAFPGATTPPYRKKLSIPCAGRVPGKADAGEVTKENAAGMCRIFFPSLFVPLQGFDVAYKKNRGNPGSSWPRPQKKGGSPFGEPPP